MVQRHTSIYRQPTPAERELARQRLVLHALRRTLATRELALGDLRRHLISFEGRYIRQVGVLYRQLDHWERRFTRLQSAQLSLEELEAELAADHHQHHDDLSDIPTPEPPQRTAAPTDLRTLFRELARRIHPDHATSALDEHHRTRLMAQANDAYLRKDLATLQRMFDGFEALDTPTTTDAELSRILHQIQLVQQDTLAVNAAHAALLTSEHAQLEQSCIAAARTGRDLLAEMAARVHGQIGIAMARFERELHRLKHPPKGLRTRDLLSAETRVTLPNLKRH